MQATILLAHGSRDPEWRIPIDRVAERMRHLNPQLTVRCAFLELSEPNMFAVTAELAALQVQCITIVPLFLGIGRHTRKDLPQLVRQIKESYPQIAFVLRPSVGEDSRVVELLANLSMPNDLPSTMA